MSEQLKIFTRSDFNTRIITVTGTLDYSTRLAFKEGMGGISGNALVLDLNAVDYVDSSGLGELVALGKRCAETGGKMALVYSTPAITHILRITSLDKIFNCFTSLDDAVKSVDGNKEK